MAWYRLDRSLTVAHRIAHVANLGRDGRVIRNMTKRILLLLTVVTGLLASAGPANAKPATEELFGNYNFLLEASARPTMLHGDFATFRTN